MTLLYDAYGCDPITVEFVLSLLSFAEPVGGWLRQWAHKRLDEATSGLHSQMLSSFLLGDTCKSAPESSENWMTFGGFTVSIIAIAHYAPHENTPSILNVVYPNVLFIIAISVLNCNNI